MRGCQGSARRYQLTHQPPRPQLPAKPHITGPVAEDRLTHRGLLRLPRHLVRPIRDLTPRTSQTNPRDLLFRINQILNGLANYFEHAVTKRTFRMLANFRLATGRQTDRGKTRHRVSG
ncbi:group II intron maturase-specific domain-containing protein [Streptomyces sp. NPDC020799]|uniref:group II intron maturase-specific domain-containing protein n=1 Tax=Streptomyces sp. NPDC020799 TaxID=3365091 RepID=UPI0037BDB006